MPLQAFSFPQPETRFFKAGSLVYKFKIRGDGSNSAGEVTSRNCFNKELEEIIRTVLSNLESLQPFTSTHFKVFPYKKWWEGMSKVMCKHHGSNLRAYPFILILYLEDNGKNEEEKLSPAQEEVLQKKPSVLEPQSKRQKRDSPLEGAILKDLIRDSETKVSVVRLHTDDQRAEREVQKELGCADEKWIKDFDKSQQKSGFIAVRGSGTPGEVHPGTIQDMGTEDSDEEGDVPVSVAESSVNPGILTWVASHIFPFSWFFREAAGPRHKDGRCPGCSGGK